MKVINRIEASMFYKKIAHKSQLIFIIVFIISNYDSAAINLSRLDENEPDFVEVKSYYKNLIVHKRKTSFSILENKFYEENIKQRGTEQEYNYKGLENFIHDKPLFFIYPELSGNRNEEKTTDFTNKFIVYPNPSEGSFRLEWNSNSNSNFEIEIYDLLGRKIYTTTTLSYKENLFLDLKNIENGLYRLAVFEDSNQIFSQSISIIK